MTTLQLFFEALRMCGISSPDARCSDGKPPTFMDVLTAEMNERDHRVGLSELVYGKAATKK